MSNNIEFCWTKIMAKHSGGVKRVRAKNSATSNPGAVGTGWKVQRDAGTGHFGAARETRVGAVMAAAERSGLLHEKSGRIGGRVSPALVKQAKAQTGIETDTDLIEFALANIALDDKFAESFRAVRGTVDPDLNLGF
jgi:hypothetical protein